MQDDCYIITTDGWKAETYRIIEKDKKGKEKDKGWACDLVPKPLIVARYFPQEQDAIEWLQGDLENTSAQMSELVEEHGGEEGIFSAFDKVNKSNVTARLKEIRNLFNQDEDSQEETAVLNKWLDLYNQEAALKKKLKNAELALDNKVYLAYPRLTEDEVKTLVVDDKWMAVLETSILGETERINQALANRVKELAERYETPLPLMVRHVSELEARVNHHLEMMGFI